MGELVEIQKVLKNISDSDMGFSFALSELFRLIQKLDGAGHSKRCEHASTSRSLRARNIARF
jgi:hypothetical protein